MIVTASCHYDMLCTGLYGKKKGGNPGNVIIIVGNTTVNLNGGIFVTVRRY